MSAVLSPPIAPTRHPTEIDVVDLFAGAGGADEALVQVARELGVTIRGHWVVNHWDAACESQVANNPGAVLIVGDDIPAEVPAEGFVVIHDAVEDVATDLVAPGRGVHLLIMAPPCTHFSKARGGKPKDEQQRGTVEFGWEFVDAKRPRFVITENVEDYRTWGPLDAEGRVIKSRKGEFYRRWKAGWAERGYVFDDAILNAADYGALTTRRRYFGIARLDGKPVRFPKQTHSKGGKVPGTLPWRAAAEAIDFRKTGEDLWERKRPLAPNTVARIARGFHKKGPMWVPLAESLRAYERAYRPMHKNMAEIFHALGLEEVKVKKRQGKTFISVGPSTFAESLAAVETHRVVRRYPTTEPVPLVKMLEAASSREDVERLLLHLEEHALVTSNDRPETNRSTAHDAATYPMPTVTGNDRVMVANPALTMSGLGGGEARESSLPYATFTGGGAAWIILNALILPWEGSLGGKERREAGMGNLARAVEDVFQAFTQRGAGHLVTALVELAQGALITPGHGERTGQAPRVLDTAQQPFWAATGSGVGLASLTRFLCEYYSNGRTTGDDEPIPPITTHDRFAFVTGVLRNGRVTVHTRMVDVPEVAAGMGFPKTRIFVGNETEQKKQIGNAWEVNVGKALFRVILEDMLAESEGVGA